MKSKYEVTKYTGVPVETDNSGNYVIKRDPQGNFKLRDWRTGKHTKGKYRKIGQLFLTENDMLVAVIATAPVRFKNRHDYTPLQRFTNEMLPLSQIEEAKKRLDI
jgi:muconolactone delta-isomerase